MQMGLCSTNLQEAPLASQRESLGLFAPFAPVNHLSHLWHIECDIYHIDGRHLWKIRSQQVPGISRVHRFLDWTVIGIAIHGRSNNQNASFNEHNRRHLLKFQTITAPNVLILDATGLIEGSRYDWAFYV